MSLSHVCMIIESSFRHMQGLCVCVLIPTIAEEIIRMTALTCSGPLVPDDKMHVCLGGVVTDELAVGVVHLLPISQYRVVAADTRASAFQRSPVRVSLRAVLHLAER